MDEVTETKPTYSNEQLLAITDAYHASKRGSFTNEWCALHVKHGILASENSEENLRSKLGSLYRENIIEECMVLRLTEISRIYHQSYNDKMSKLTMHASSYVQPPFMPICARSPRDMVIDGASRIRKFGGK